MSYVLLVLFLALLYASLAKALDLLVGQLGAVVVCQAALFGIGAYATALAALEARIPVVLSLSISVTAAVLVALLISLTSLRLRGDYFVLATFAFQVIWFGIVNNWVSVTRGPLGIPLRK